MAEGSQRALVLGTTAAAVLLLLAAPTPAACLRTLSAAGSATDQAAPLVALLALLAWALAAWLAVTVLLTAGGHLPGQAGRALQPLSRWVAPATVRRAVELALGLTVVLGTLASPAAAAAPGSEAPRYGGAPVASLDWAASAPGTASPPEAAIAPGTASPPGTASDAAPDLDWSTAGDPSAPAPPAATPPAPTGAGTAHVVVQPGDTLWGLAEQELRDRSTGPAAGSAGAGPTDAEVAAAWPAWWSANREAVGDDPDLLQPGTPLARPGEDPPAAG